MRIRYLALTMSLLFQTPSMILADDQAVMDERLDYNAQKQATEPIDSVSSQSEEEVIEQERTTEIEIQPKSGIFRLITDNPAVEQALIAGGLMIVIAVLKYLSK